MLSHLADVSIRSLALAAVAAIAAWRPKAAWQHAVWTAVAAGMLGLLVFGEVLPKLPLRILDAPNPPPVQAAVPVPHFTLPPPNQTASSSEAAPQRETRIDWLAFGYGAVALAFLLRLGLGALLAKRLIRSSKVAEGFRESEKIAVPLTVGWFRPVILLPIEWRTWEPYKLAAVLAHEGAHARRRDGLVAALAGINRCLFWFHPLAWWLERRLALLAELACDEACVAERGDCQGYASLLVEMAQVVDPSYGRLREHALTMAAGPHVRRRVESILTEGRRFSRGLSGAGLAAIAFCAVPIIGVAGTMTLEHQAPLTPLKLPPLSSPTPPPLVAQARPQTPAPVAQLPAKRVEFEVASIRPADPSPFRTCAGDRFTLDAARLDIKCISIQRLMEYAFSLPQKQVDGPDWMHYHRGPGFDISAKLPDEATADQIPEMLRTLLVDRFKLVYHIENRNQNIDALVVAQGGVKLEEASQPPAPDSPGGPTSIDTVNGRVIRRANGGGRSQNNVRIGDYRSTVPSPGSIRWEFSGATMEGLADALANLLKRPVADMTGLKSRYNIALEVKTVEWDPAAVAAAQTIDDANRVIDDSLTGVRDNFKKELQKFGLQLEMRNAPVEFAVLDRVEQKPTDN